MLLIFKLPKPPFNQPFYIESLGWYTIVYESFMVSGLSLVKLPLTVCMVKWRFLPVWMYKLMYGDFTMTVTFGMTHKPSNQKGKGSTMITKWEIPMNAQCHLKWSGAIYKRKVKRSIKTEPTLSIHNTEVAMTSWKVKTLTSKATLLLLMENMTKKRCYEKREI